MKKLVLFTLLSVLFVQKNWSQDLVVPTNWGSNSFKSGTGDGATMTTYNSILKLHFGLAIGSPYVSNGNGGYVDKATIVFDGRTGNINSSGNISSSSFTPNNQLYFPTFNDLRTSCFVKGTGDGASLTTYNTLLKLHSGLAIGSPYVSDGNGGCVDKATIVFDGRTGNIITLGLITANKIHTSEVKVDLNVPGPDYVFNNDYKLKELSELKDFINTNKHLPEIESAVEMKEKGINVADFQVSLLKKIEELTLYIINQDEKIKELELKVNSLKTE